MQPFASPRERTGVVQLAKGTVKASWDWDEDTYQITGRPDFDNQVKIDLLSVADNNGEKYFVEHTLNDGKSFVLPTIQRRHRVAWALWRDSLNKALRDNDRSDFNQVLELAKLSHWYFSSSEFRSARERGENLEGLSDTIFNADWNIWIGPGDENEDKGRRIRGALKNILAKPKSKQAYRDYRWAVSDPRVKRDFEWDDSDLGWSYNKVRKGRETPDTRHGMDVAEELIYYQTGSIYADRHRPSSYRWG